MFQVTLGKPSHQCLIEAFIRFESDEAKLPEDWTLTKLQSVNTGLGCYGDYKQAWEKGLMVPANMSTFKKGRPEWWKLTKLGAQVLLNWRGFGYHCKNRRINDQPPLNVNVDHLPPFLVLEREECKILNKRARCCLGCGRDHDEPHMDHCVIYGEEWWAERPHRMMERLKALTTIIANNSVTD